MKDAVLVGLVGEAALCEYLTRRGYEQRVDLVLRQFGDGGRDVEVSGLVIQVKTRRKGIGRRSFVKRGDRGHIVPFKCELFVFAEWNETTPSEAPQLLGWMWSVDVSRGGRFERSPLARARHWNLRVRDLDLLPMSRLIDELGARGVFQ